MRHDDFGQFLKRGSRRLGPGAVAAIIAEDGIELASTARHLRRLGFAEVLVLAPEGLRAGLPEGTHRIGFATGVPGAAARAVDALIAALPGRWIFWCYNAEYLFFPYCETRRVGEMLTFHEGERRAAMPTWVIDLYAGDLAREPDGVALDDAWLDAAGYHAFDRDGRAREIDLHGGLRWRFEEHVPEAERRIDRIGLLRARPGLRMGEDGRLSEAELNTVSCPWHRNLTAAVASFRAAKALRANPGSRGAVASFLWPRSCRFEWRSAQLLELGMMEPGQWV